MARVRRRSLQAMENDAKAADLYRRGLSFRQIAREMGWRSPTSARDAVHRAAMDAARDPQAAAEALTLMLERIQDRRRAAWTVASRRHLAYSASGQLVTDPATGEPLVDDGPVLSALDRLRRDDELEAKLLGLYAPVKKQVEVITEDAVDARIRELNLQMAAADAEAAAGIPGAG